MIKGTISTKDTYFKVSSIDTLTQLVCGSIIVQKRNPAKRLIVTSVTLVKQLDTVTVSYTCQRINSPQAFTVYFEHLKEYYWQIL